MKIVAIVGARPQFIKAAALSRVIKREGKITELLLHTGQHYDKSMSDIFFDELEIPKPAYNLEVGSSSHGKQTGKMLELLDDILLKEKPDMVLVYGDTNSTLAGALSAKKLHIPVAHVEAGLRSRNEYQPEEINRQLTDQIANLLFATSNLAVETLRSEGVASERIIDVGDIMFDTVLYMQGKVDAQKVLTQYQLEAKSYVLVTLHRAENTDDLVILRNILDALSELAKEIKVFIPLHPRTSNLLKEHNLFEHYKQHLTIVEPVGFSEIAALTQNSQLVVTDSGGLQKESFYHQVSCVVLRNETEWTELLELKCNKLLPPSTKDEIYQGIISAMDDLSPNVSSPYGDGKTAEKIHATLIEYLSGNGK